MCSALIHLVSGELASNEQLATEIAQDCCSSSGLVFTPDVVGEPQPELGIQGGPLGCRSPAGRFDQVSVCAEGYSLDFGASRVTLPVGIVQD